MSGRAYMVPELETGGPVLMLETEDGKARRVVPIAFMQPDPGLMYMRALVRWVMRGPNG